MKKQYGIRMTGETADKVESFAKVHSMSATAAAEFFVKLGIDSLQKNDLIDARMDTLEERLKLVYQSLVKSSIYLTMLPPIDQQKAVTAAEQADKAAAKIFGEVA
jgi:acyl carrier protein